MLLISLSTTAYLTVQKAYISDQVCYERSGRALAAVDTSFSSAGIIGLPIVGWMLKVFGWQVPIFSLAILSLIAALVIGIRLPKTQTRTETETIQPKMWKLICKPHILYP